MGLVSTVVRCRVVLSFLMVASYVGQSEVCVPASITTVFSQMQATEIGVGLRVHPPVGTPGYCTKRCTAMREVCISSQSFFFYPLLIRTKLTELRDGLRSNIFFLFF